jgi:hypothetical protein
VKGLLNSPFVPLAIWMLAPLKSTFTKNLNPVQEVPEPAVHPEMESPM